MEKIFKKLVIILSFLLIASVLLGAVAVPKYKRAGYKFDFFSSNIIAENIKNLELNMTSIIYVKDEAGEWQEYQRIHGDENRIWVGIDKMPENLKNAFIAIEDETFNTHKGINWRRTIGAIGNYFFKFDDTEFGGSTITQQLIKNITLDKGKNATRKVREIIRAMLIERRLNKTQILEAYLNTIALGNGICGVEVAANYYFNKSVGDLTLIECATLAAITQNPSKYNPVTGMENNNERRNLVLQKMHELGFISSKEFVDNYKKEITLDNTQKDDYEVEINSYFVDALIEEIIADLAVKYNCSEDIASTMLYNGGFKIYSTLDSSVQAAMDEVYLNTDKYFKLKGKNLQGETVHAQSAMTIMDYEGHILGIVGGAGEKTVNRGLNRATGAPRQPGSTMKPIGVYALAIDKDIVHYTSKVLDQPIENYYPDGKKGPKEWYGYYKGNITVDYAIRKSANTIPVRLLQEIGIDTSYDFLVNKLGCKHLTETDKNLASLALGGCAYGMTTTESAAAYAIFGNKGVYHDPTTYHKIENIDGEIVLEYDITGNQVISPASATIMNHLLQGVVYGSEGTGSGIRGFNYSLKAFAKTGTSSESNDLWMVAGSPYYVGSVWYGFDMPQQIKSTSAAATIWRDVMKTIHKGIEKKTFEDSEDVFKKGSGYYKVGTKPDNYTTYGSSSSNESSSSNTSSATSSAVVSNPSVPNTGSAGGVTSNPVVPGVPQNGVSSVVTNSAPTTSVPSSQVTPKPPVSSTPSVSSAPDSPPKPVTPSEPTESSKPESSGSSPAESSKPESSGSSPAESSKPSESVPQDTSKPSTPESSSKEENPVPPVESDSGDDNTQSNTSSKPQGTN
ncbi:MAG: transglycosylase domain-containing protein [Clostridia bacterium]|nr:transglycosylase domain-containing protein [Clostridia bacterium]